MPEATVRDIESAFVAHWSTAGGILRAEMPLTRLPYNGVIRTRLPADRSDLIRGVRAHAGPHRQANALGCARIVLHSSEMARGLHRRTGFTEHCEFRFYATGPIWTGEH